MLADNRLSELGSTDQQLLAENLKLLTVDGLDLDVEAATAFTMGEIDKIIHDAGETAEEDPDDLVEEVVKGPAVNRPGDLWDLAGRHRVICGNSLEADVWRRLMNSEKAAMSCSDPPYNVPIAGHVSRRRGWCRISRWPAAKSSATNSRPSRSRVFRLIAAHSEPASIHMAFTDWHAW